MKNRIIALASIVLVAISSTSLVSCEKEEVKEQAAVETTKVDFNIGVANASTTARAIDRGNVPFYVQDVTIKAVSAALTPFTVTETFTFNPNSASATAAQFGLDNVALGTNTFSATSTSAPANKVLSLTSDVDGKVNPTDVMDVMKAKVPYITCTSANVNAVITKTGNTPVNLVMDTNNGRVIAKFIAQLPDVDNYKVEITAKAGATTKTGSINYVNSSDNVNNSKVATFEWSDENCVAGATVDFTFKIYEKSGSVLLNTITKSLTVGKAKSTNAVYTIKSSDVHTDIEQGGILLTFPSIGDINIID